MYVGKVGIYVHGLRGSGRENREKEREKRPDFETGISNL